jgi:hypothetical protein
VRDLSDEYTDVETEHQDRIFTRLPAHLPDAGERSRLTGLREHAENPPARGCAICEAHPIHSPEWVPDPPEPA